VTHQSATHAVEDHADAGQRIAQLRHVLALVRRIADEPRPAPSPDAERLLDENARTSGAYQAAPAIVRRRFDVMAAEISQWATAGVEALLAARNAPVPPRAAAARLAAELAEALNRLTVLLKPYGDGATG